MKWHVLMVMICHDRFKIGISLVVYLGLSENRVYSQLNSHLIGIMIINHWV